MRKLSSIYNLEGSETASEHSPTTVCMHVLGCARTDGRVMREATALVEAGFDVSIVDVEGELTLPLEEEIQGVSIKHIIMPNWFVPTRFKPWFLVKAAQMLVRRTIRLMQVPADIYHAHDETALLACYIAAQVRRKPLIFDAHEFPLFQVPLSELSTGQRWFGRISAVLLAMILPRCAGVITVSSPIAQEIHNRYRVPEVTLVRNMPSYRVVPKSGRLRQYLGLSPNIRIVLYQGGLQLDRGLDKLIRATRFLERGIVIVMMGKGDRVTLSKLEFLIASEGVADRVKIIPPVPYEELLNWTSSADIGLIVYSPDYSLNVRWCLPNKLFEYLMAGLPVLSSQLDAVAEVIKTYDVGQVVSSLTPEDIGKAINTMLADTVGLSRMHHNALEEAHRDLCWEKEGQQLIHLYRNIIRR